MKKLIIILLLIGTKTIAANQWVFGKVKSLEDYAGYNNGYYQVLITLKDKRWSGSDSGSTNCKQRFRIKIGAEGMTEESKNRIFSLMLSAFMGNKSVGLFVNPTTGPYCTVQIGKIM